MKGQKTGKFNETQSEKDVMDDYETSKSQKRRAKRSKDEGINKSFEAVEGDVEEEKAKSDDKDSKEGIEDEKSNDNNERRQNVNDINHHNGEKIKSQQSVSTNQTQLPQMNNAREEESSLCNPEDEENKKCKQSRLEDGSVYQVKEVDTKPRSGSAIQKRNESINQQGKGNESQEMKMNEESGPRRSGTRKNSVEDEEDDDLNPSSKSASRSQRIYSEANQSDRDKRMKSEDRTSRCDNGLRRDGGKSQSRNYDCGERDNDGGRSLRMKNSNIWCKVADLADCFKRDDNQHRNECKLSKEEEKSLCEWFCEARKECKEAYKNPCKDACLGFCQLPNKCKAKKICKVCKGYKVRIEDPCGREKVEPRGERCERTCEKNEKFRNGDDDSRCRRTERSDRCGGRDSRRYENQNRCDRDDGRQVYMNKRESVRSDSEEESGWRDNGRSRSVKGEYRTNGRNDREENQRGRNEDFDKKAKDEIFQLKCDLLKMQMELQNLKECLKCQILLTEKNKCTMKKVKDCLQCNLCIFMKILDKLRDCQLFKLRMCDQPDCSQNRCTWKKDFDQLMKELISIKCEMELMKQEKY